MAIIIKCDSSDFRKAFYDMGRGSQFSNHALDVLFEHLENLSEDDDVELDVISICCDFEEYQSVDDFLDSYPESLDDDDEIDDDEKLEKIKEYLNNNTMLLECEENSIIFAAF